ncbi:MAG: endonuclease/exonuclease/phosphatase family protein [Anaerolineales bacterium]|nr:endonuclease/exonuclease/phosphatase family protein [Anaerolineales bacterium]
MLNLLRSDLKSYWLRWLFAAILVTFGLQELRVLFVSFVGYLRDSTGMSSLSLAPVAVGIFALAFLAGPLNRLLGTRTTLWLTAGGLAVVRVLEQIAQTAMLDLYLSAAATALFLMWIPLAVGISRARGGNISMHLALGWLLGLVLDTGLQIAFRTLDVSWQPGLFPLALVVVLAGLLLWTLSKLVVDAPAATDGSWGSSAALLAVGPWLFLQLMLFQNTALVSSLSGWSTPLAGAALILGNALGLWHIAKLAPKRNWLNTLLYGAFVLLQLFLAFNQPLVPGLFIILGQVFSLTLGYFIFTAAAATAGKPGLLRSTLFNGLGHIFFVLLTFIYYASYDIDFGLRSGALPPVAVVLATLFILIAVRAKADKSKESTPPYTPVALAAALLVVPLLLSFAWSQPTAQAAESNTIRVINYNLHDAVNTDGRVDPEALARIIEESGADVVGLQEISRGWLIWGGMDMLEWLAQRLDMQYIWGPTADAQWGNAILTRLPIIQTSNHPLPPEDVLLLRGYLYAEIDVNGRTLTVIDTHFSEKAGQDDIRAQQASVLVDVASGRPATIIMGDLNSLPDSLALEVMLGGGFVDISRESGLANTFTYPSFAADHQIDYIFISPDLSFSNFAIPLTTASDHLPLSATITLP